MTALDYFDVPENGRRAHELGYAQSDNPYGFSTPEGIEWARRWGMAEVGSRETSGTFGATDEEYLAGGMQAPSRDLSGRPVTPRSELEEYVFGQLARAYAEAWERELEKLFGVLRTTADEAGRIARMFGVPTRLLGFGPTTVVVDELEVDRPLPADWATTKREDLLKPVLGTVHDDPVLRRYLLEPKPLDPELDGDLLTPGGWAGIVSTGYRRLEQMRATMQEPKPVLRAPKHLGTAPTSRAATARSRRRNP